MDLTEKKLQFITEMIQLSDRLLLDAEDTAAMFSAYSVNGFDAGKQNQFRDDDFLVHNKHLTAAQVADIMFAIGTINTAFLPVLNSLRKALLGGLP